MVRVRVQATQEEFALINKAARKLGLTPSQFIARAATRLRGKQKLGKARVRSHSFGKTQLPRRKRKS